MTTAQRKLLAAGLVLAVAVAYLGYVGFRKGSSYYLTVDRFLAEGQFHAERVRLHGTVAGPAEATEEPAPAVRFELAGQTGRIRVDFRGVLPDRFAPGGEVIVVGRLGADGAFQADEVLTKCASKYAGEETERS